MKFVHLLVIAAASLPACGRDGTGLPDTATQTTTASNTGGATSKTTSATVTASATSATTPATADKTDSETASATASKTSETTASATSSKTSPATASATSSKTNPATASATSSKTSETTASATSSKTSSATASATSSKTSSATASATSSKTSETTASKTSSATASTTASKTSSSTGSATSTGSSGAPSCSTTVPTPTTSTTVKTTIKVSGTYDGEMKRFCADPNSLGDGNQGENQKPVFTIAAGGTLKNAIIGGSDGCSAADGVHCEGNCTIQNVWWGDVGEDAATFRGTNVTVTVDGGGAWSASDKVFQDNSNGSQVTIKNFYAKGIGKLYRSCGNCSNNSGSGSRHVTLTNVAAANVSSTLVGINSNYGDTATITGFVNCGSVKMICERFQGNNTGDEPPALGNGSDGKSCIY